jgi:ABC-type bacteriocin/lantibiotic exporter with double-glycine peptidase domain
MKLKNKKVPYVEQLSITECGLCCVAMILRYHKSYESLHDLRLLLDTGRDGSSITQLVNLLHKLNFKTKTYKAQTEGLAHINLPGIIFWEDSHFVILEKINKDYATIVDPASGRVKLKIADFKKSYSDYIIAALPEETFVRRKKESSIWKKYIYVLIKNKPLFYQIILFSVLSYISTLFMPIIVQNLIDQTLNDVGLSNLKPYFFLIIIAAILFMFIDFFKNRQLIKLRINIDKDISTELFDHLLKLPFKYFDIRNKADILSSLNSTTIIRETLARQLITGLINIGAIIFIVIYMCYQSLIMSIILLVLFIVNTSILLITKPYFIDFNKYLVFQQNKYQSVQIESIYSILGIKMSAIESDVKQRWTTRFKEYLDKFKYKEEFSNYLNSLMNFTQVVSPLIILITGIYLVTINYLTIGQTIALYSLSSTFFSLSSSVFDTWMSYLNSAAYLERIGDVISSPKEEDAQEKTKLNLLGNIKFEDVCFSYSKNSNMVIKNISLDIREGQKVAIVGKSGSGKSTLAKLLVGLYQPTNGSIYYDNINMKEINTSHARRQMGIVPQEVSLFNKNILENIRMDREDITLEQVIIAAKIAQIHDEINAMPLKYNTIISEMGVNLSGGQRQRIALARAIVNNPKIIVLDEATSSLDNNNETEVSNYFSKIGCTRIVIAHRLPTIIDADLIIVMDDGLIAEQGTHGELLNNKSYYYNLYQKELFNSNDART